MRKIIKVLSIVIIFIFICICVLGVVYDKECFGELYIKMTEINDNKELIGLSEGEVIELLGEPRYRYTDNRPKLESTYYTYGAGTTYKKTFFGNTYGRKYYELEIIFDTNGIVRQTYIEEST